MGPSICQLTTVTAVALFLPSFTTWITPYSSISLIPSSSRACSVFPGSAVSCRASLSAICAYYGPSVPVTPSLLAVVQGQVRSGQVAPRPLFQTTLASYSLPRSCLLYPASLSLRCRPVCLRLLRLPLRSSSLGAGLRFSSEVIDRGKIRWRTGMFYEERETGRV